MSEIPVVVNAAPQLHAILCAVMASYTLIGVLDHERWMKVCTTLCAYIQKQWGCFLTAVCTSWVGQQ